ncbi:tetratricopeptide repeat protein [Devosia sp.]|uniref:tetratricopeptide repeat-containing sulfotransferase family protein n=1 Tax=Devosia sp. TaxID=1871048 RepID=UPI003BA975CD
MSKPPKPNRPGTNLPQRAPIADVLQDGLRLHQAGRGDEAARLYEQVLAREPLQPAANHLLGLVRLQQGKPDDAVRLISRATSVNKSDPQYFANLGAALNAAGRPAEAVEALDRAIALKPAFPGAHSNRGMALKALGRLDDAAASYRQAVSLAPAEPGFYLNLANVLGDLSELDAAESAYREALRLRPVYPAAVAGLSGVLDLLGRPEDALTVSAEALAKAPNEADFHYWKGRALYRLGRLKEALAASQRALQLRPAFGEAHFHAAHMRRWSATDHGIAAMEAIYSNAAAPVDDRVYTGFGLAKALGDAGDHERSVTTYIGVNALHRPRLNFSLPAVEADFARLVEMFSGAAGNQASDSVEDSPIFVVGLPRSGKSTVESVLARHADVYAAGEQRLLSRLVDRYGSGGPEGLRQIGVEYARFGRELGGGKRIIDTMPPNFRLLGFIRAALPNARVIHCVRDSGDHAVAIFEKFLPRSGYEFASDLTEIVAYHRAYRKLMAQWHSLFPGFILDVDVATLSGQAAKPVADLLGFAGLPWDPACLAVVESEPQLGNWTAEMRAANWAAHRAEWMLRHPELWA